MASSQQPDSTTEARSAPQQIPQQPHAAGVELPNPTPVEMSTLESKATPVPSKGSLDRQTSTGSDSKPTGPARTNTTTALEQASHPVPPPPSIPENIPTPLKQRAFSTAIGPSSDSPVVPSKDGENTGPTLLITLLLTSGARHPFRLDAKYLSKRNVEVQGNNPFNLSVYKLKELILREWREEWEAKPSSPSYIRLISFGKLLDDKAPLKDSKFNTDAPNVLHMTIKPQDFIDDEDAKGGKASSYAARDGEGRSPGCRCTVM